MLVELIGSDNGPRLFEAREAYADQAFFSKKDKGGTVLDSTSYGSSHTYKIDLPYPVFRWAYARSIANGEAFLDVKPEALLKIKADYIAAHSSPA